MELIKINQVIIGAPINYPNLEMLRWNYVNEYRKANIYPRERTRSE